MIKNKKTKSNGTDSKENKNNKEAKKDKNLVAKDKEIEELKEALANAEDAKLRALAEADNTLRRMDKEKQENAKKKHRIQKNCYES